MSFFRRRHPIVGGREGPRDDDSLRRIEEGGIPLRAEQRLRALGTTTGLFSSGLAVNEFALVENLGVGPLAPILGASVVRVARQYLPPLRPYVKRNVRLGESPYEEPSVRQQWSYAWNETLVVELGTVTDAWNQVRRLALGRLTEEALQVDADAVVGVDVHRGEHDWSRRTIDYLITGTAIRAPDSTRTRLPILTGLSVQDYWRLRTAGCEPAGLLLATAVLFASPSRRKRVQRLRAVRQNYELEEVTEAFARARELVRSRLESQARGARAGGILGLEFSHTVHRHEFTAARSVEAAVGPGWHRGQLGIPFYVSRAGEAERSGWVITMHGVATAIRAPAALPELRPQLVLHMDRPGAESPDAR